MIKSWPTDRVRTTFNVYTLLVSIAGTLLATCGFSLCLSVFIDKDCMVCWPMDTKWNTFWKHVPYKTAKSKMVFKHDQMMHFGHLSHFLDFSAQTQPTYYAQWFPLVKVLKKVHDPRPINRLVEVNKIFG